MPVNPDAVGEKGSPTKRSWNSDDALLYALGVGAGVDELAFTTENTKDTPQRVLPTMAVVIGMGGLALDVAAVPRRDEHPRLLGLRASGLMRARERSEG
jgi:hypothetical protein